MTHTYNLTGMTCGSCESKVKSQLLTLPNITEVKVSKENHSAEITMERHVSLDKLQAALGGSTSKYTITAKNFVDTQEQAKSWLQTYKPILLIFAYILGATILIEYSYGEWNWMRWMNHFMAAFFLVFSFFKFLNLNGFATSYSMYDVIATKFKPWGYIYPFIELILGIAFLLNFQPIFTNIVTFFVMLISIIGVINTVINKRKIQCACLGDVFNLPMSTVTIVEDGLMIVMSIIMLIIML